MALRTDAGLRKGKFTIEARNLSGAPVPKEAPGVSVGQPGLAVVPQNPADAPPAVLTLPGGQQIELHEGHYILGRHLENDIVINDSNVSRRHAEFISSAGEVTVRDLGSTNGTKVNGVLITGEQHLEHGDVINLGTAQVTFEAS